MHFIKKELALSLEMFFIKNYTVVRICSFTALWIVFNPGLHPIVEGSSLKQAAETTPRVLSHHAVRFETAQSWNRGRGNLIHPGTGNDGINYPLEPYTGIRHGNAGGGKGKGKGNHTA